MVCRALSRLFVVACLLLLPAAPAAPVRAAEPSITFEREVLDNGLEVIYAPLRSAPVVHVRVLYHVGSRNERPDRQGFAHMFEHMMFRGSAHVAPEEHMKTIGVVGGYCNAFTSFDQTVYVNTVPSNQLALPLYLEADRMASFKVSDTIYQTERKVVGEEDRMRANQPYGKVYEDFLKAAFTTHSYRWTPIGVMSHLAAAKSAELQDFFNTYYVPNNAILVIAGDIDVPATKALVKKYFGWIPRGKEPSQEVPAEPQQTSQRRVEVTQRVPLPMVMVGWHVPAYRAGEQPALSLLATILGGGRSSRLEKLLVQGENPQCASLGVQHGQYLDPGVFGINALVLAGKDPDAVEKAILNGVAEVADKGVTADELAKAKTLYRVGLIRGRETAEQLAGQLGTEALVGGDVNRVNTALARMDAVTEADIRAAAQKFLRADKATVLRVQPGAAAPATSQPAPAADAGPASPAHEVTFPADWPAKAPVVESQLTAKFEKGREVTVGGVHVIVMEDHRLPLVSWNLTLRGGSDSEPAGKEGLGELTASLIRRGAGNLSYAQLNEDLESRGISLELSDASDTTQLSGSCTTEQLDHAVGRAADLLHRPTLAADEFSRLQTQTVNELRVGQESPTEVASEDLSAALFGKSPLGRTATPASVSGITLEDIKAYRDRIYKPGEALLVISGDIGFERGKEVAARLLEEWSKGTPPAADYTLPPAPAKRRIILVDRPDGKQSTIRMGLRAYTNQSEERFAGVLAGQILSRGIDSRLGKYVRAEKGLAYSVTGSFNPGRHGGSFIAGTDTAAPSTAAAIEAMFKVFSDMCKDPVTDKELAEAKTRVSGGMVMGMQTIGQQAAFRTQAILNGYPIDYYDTYPARIGQVTAEQVRAVMQQYVRDDRIVIVVVAPAEAVKEQLKTLGDVEVVPMPNKRAEATPPATPAALKPAA